MIDNELLKSMLSQAVNHYSVQSNAVTANGLKQSALKRTVVNTMPMFFEHEVKQNKVTNQKQSGRCWLFAACNVIRMHMNKTYDLEDFQVSQSYLFFYDKLEKANYFLESIIKTVDEPIHSRLLDHLLSAPVGDGGQWDMVVDLVEKYGLVPQEVMPDSACASSSRDMDTLLTHMLHEDAFELREAIKAGKDGSTIDEMKKTMLHGIYNALVVCLGVPPQMFNFNVKTKDGQIISKSAITPLQFYHDVVKLDLTQYVSIINGPTSDKPFNHVYTVDYLGNVVEGRGIRYLNLTIDELKALTKAQLDDGEPVWFGSDCGFDMDRNAGVMAHGLYDFKGVVGFETTWSKANRLDYSDSAMNHAMVIEGYHQSGHGTNFKVENSWGDEPGKNGFFVMNEAWFDENVYQIVVNRKYLTKKQQDIYDGELKHLEPWDPMGTLA